MSYTETSLYLVNRQLRRAGYREALDYEEETIKTLAAQGAGVQWIAEQIKDNRQFKLAGI